MTKNYQLDTTPRDSEERPNEIDIEMIELWWDSLPDYCKTLRKLEKMKDLVSPSLWNKLTTRNSLGNCG
jgi:hypothetical protein